MKKKIACFIPAKGSSTRLHGKNNKDLLGKPMVQYVIEAAKEAQLFGAEIYLSTESQEIQKTALSLGINAKELRPAALSKDPYGIKDVLFDFLNRNSFTEEWSTIIILLPTSPLLTSEDIQKAVKEFESLENSTLLSVTETDHNAYRSLEIKNDCIAPIFPQKIKKRTQELSPTYRINGAMIIIDRVHFLEHKDFFSPDTLAYVMPKERSIDVDTAFDFALAEILLKNKK